MIGYDETSFLLRLAGIVHGKHGLIFWVQLVSEIYPTFLHPVIKIAFSYFIGEIQHVVIRL